MRLKSRTTGKVIELTDDYEVVPPSLSDSLYEDYIRRCAREEADKVAQKYIDIHEDNYPHTPDIPWELKR